MSERTAMVVGGSNGIGMGMVQQLLKDNYNKIIVVDRQKPSISDDRIVFSTNDLSRCDMSVFYEYQDIDTLIITAGFGRPASFDTFNEKEIENSFRVNAESIIKIIKAYYSKFSDKDNFDCLIMGSIAGLVSSPLFAVYAATKAALCRFIESINIELEMKGTKNRILNVSPGSIKGTKFNGGDNQLEQLENLAIELIKRMRDKEELYIPDYEEVYRGVIERYTDDPHQYGLDSYEYKMNSGRLNNRPQIKIGYLSGTFDLFHIGHLNMLKRAKDKCDYLVVGVHKDASHKGKEAFISFEERSEIVKSIKYVDEVIMSKPEDVDVYEDIKYNYLFVGSDYKGTERFNRYEEFFADKDVEIIYFPYTAGTSSTQLRNAISK